MVDSVWEIDKEAGWEAMGASGLSLTSWRFSSVVLGWYVEALCYVAMLSLYVEVTFYTLVYRSLDSDNDFRSALILKLNPRYKYFQIFDFLHEIL